jgi:hypothetical membrane protein
VGQTVQIAGALAILAGFALAQFGVLNQHARPYLLLNFAGAFVLSLAAYFERQWGFLLLEGVWTLVSAWGLVRLSHRSAAPS